LPENYLLSVQKRPGLCPSKTSGEAVSLDSSWGREDTSKAGQGVQPGRGDT
jgi:hypothetical protein